jgi:hypothetical protein
MAVHGAPEVSRRREGLRRDMVRVSVEGEAVDGAKEQSG